MRLPPNPMEHIATHLPSPLSPCFAARVSAPSNAPMPVGAASIMQMAASNTLIQTMVPDRLRGRVMAVYSMMFMGMAPFGSFFAGALADRLGAPITVAIGGVACIAGAAIFAARLPGWRTEARQLIIAQGLAGGDPAQEMTVRGISQR